MLNGGFNAGQAIIEAQDWSSHLSSLKGRETAEDTVERTILPSIQQLERLTLVCESMWQLLREKTSLTEEELSAKVTELDLEDGVIGASCLA